MLSERVRLIQSNNRGKSIMFDENKKIFCPFDLNLDHSTFQCIEQFKKREKHPCRSVTFIKLQTY